MLDPIVAHILNLFDTVLLTLGPDRLREATVFTLDQELSSPFYQRYKLTLVDQTKLPLWFEIAPAGVTFYLDRTNELPEWSSEWILANPEEFTQEVLFLFTSRVLVQYQGNKTVLRLYNQAGGVIRTFTYTQGLGLPCWHESRFKGVVKQIGENLRPRRTAIWFS